MKLCECGCGNPAPLADRTSTKLGWVRGEPIHFISGHHRWKRGVLYLEHDAKTGCYEWQGARIRGYGSLRYGNKHYYAHRFVYEMFVGPIPTGAVMDHICRNPLCVNPDHLRVTDAVGNARNTKRNKLNAEAVKVLRHASKSFSIAHLARVYNAPYATIRSAVCGQSWRRI